jgi:hypothetical protein
MVACYRLNGNVNSYSKKYWFSKNPHTIDYVPLNDLESQSLVCNEWAQNQSALVYQVNNKFLPLHMVNSDKITHRIARKKNAQLLHAQKCDSPFNKHLSNCHRKSIWQIHNWHIVTLTSTFKSVIMGDTKKTSLCMYTLCKNWKKIFNEKLLTFQGNSSHMKWNTINPSTVPPSLSPQVCLWREISYFLLFFTPPPPIW